MKSQSLILLVVAGACGLVAMLGVKQALNRKPDSGEQQVSVLQASMEIQPGELLNDTNTRMVQVNITACPEGAVTDIAEIQERSIKVPAAPGDWILTSKLSEKGETGAATNIPEGMRVVTIPVNATQTISGMLRPGNRVDIMLSYELTQANSGVRQKLTRTILQYVEVFAVDDRIYGLDKTGENSGGAKNISVLVKPEQGNMLRLAESMGTLSTSLRSNGDKEEIKIEVVSDEALGTIRGGNNVGAASVLSAREMFGKSGDIKMLEDSPPIPVADELQAELMRQVPSKGPEASAPLVQVAQSAPKNVWTMEILEGGTVRREMIELPDKSGAGKSGSLWDLLKPLSRP